MAVLLLIFLAGVDYPLASTPLGSAVSGFLISWSCMFSAAMHGERRGGAALGTSGAAVWSVGTFGGRCDGFTLGMSIPISTYLYVVLEGVGGDR